VKRISASGDYAGAYPCSAARVSHFWAAAISLGIVSLRSNLPARFYCAQGNSACAALLGRFRVRVLACSGISATPGYCVRARRIRALPLRTSTTRLRLRPETARRNSFSIVAGDVDLAPSGDVFVVLSGSVFDANALAVRALLSLAGSGAGVRDGSGDDDH
jgi:hypothetical protein